MARDTQRPQRPYLQSDDIDALARMNTELLSELWILRDRVLVLEHLLAKAGVVTAAAIDTFVPDADLDKKLQQERDALVQRVVNAGQRTELDLDDIRNSANTSEE